MINKLLKKLSLAIVAVCSMASISSCTSDLTYEEAPESVYTQVGVSRFDLKARELFNDKIYAVNWEQWVENYIDTRVIGTSAKLEWTNKTGANYTLPDGTVVAPDEKVELEGSMSEVSDESAPGGKVTVIQVYAFSRAVYQTANKGYLFDGSKFSGDYKLIDPVNNRSQKVELPIRENELIGEIRLIDYSVCEVEPVNGAPALGEPGDFSQPARYLVKNIAHRPGGVPQTQHIYEIRVTFLP